MPMNNLNPLPFMPPAAKTFCEQKGGAGSLPVLDSQRRLFARPWVSDDVCKTWPHYNLKNQAMNLGQMGNDDKMLNKMKENATFE